MQRVAAYCRVSTDKNDQINSLESQKRYFSEYIRQNPMWQLTEIYVDEGITGTSTKRRRAFNRMIADAENRRFDLLLTKEISRFARNTLDSIYYTRRLRDWGVGVIFLRDNINTLDPDAELRLTIMSSIAQEESRKTSDRVKWGQKRRMEQGVVFGRSLLGYDVKNGKISVNEAGADIVRQIYHKFAVEQKSANRIARELQEAGVPTFHDVKRWSGTVILRALRNEKYCGGPGSEKNLYAGLPHPRKKAKPRRGGACDPARPSPADRQPRTLGTRAGGTRAKKPPAGTALPFFQPVLLLRKTPLRPLRRAVHSTRQTPEGRQRLPRMALSGSRRPRKAKDQIGRAHV